MSALAPTLQAFFTERLIRQRQVSLGHVSVETTQIYLHADLSLKEQALARTRPPTSPPCRYRPRDHILARLEAL